MDKEVTRRDFIKETTIAASALGCSIYLNPFSAFAGNPEKDLTCENGGVIMYQ